jgi:hypothetical protein
MSDARVLFKDDPGQTGTHRPPRQSSPRRKPDRTLSMTVTLVVLGLAAFLTSGCGPVIFRFDETRTIGACPWRDAESAIACVSFRTSREPLPSGYRDGLSQRSHQTRRSAEGRSI